ncbi:MAG TPA: hypothetical protein DCS66_06170 [Flavobacteriaceae bacterium]|nr:hypothetical protein [Flavobacteriaceae bacterium]
MIKIISPYLPKKDFEDLQKLIMWNKSFPFYLNKNIAEKDEQISYPHSFCGTHGVYQEDTPRSTHYSYFSEMFRPHLKWISLLRIKVNFYPGTSTLFEHGPHTDYPFPHKGAVLALNTCNGFTRIKNRTIKSVANQMILFDPSTPHNSTTCTDEKGRWTINFNYF